MEPRTLFHQQVDGGWSLMWDHTEKNRFKDKTLSTISTYVENKAMKYMKRLLLME